MENQKPSDLARYQALVRLSTNALFMVAPVRDIAGAIADFQYTWLNEPAKQSIGYDATGMFMMQQLPDLKTTRLFEQMIKSIQDDSPTEVEIHHQQYKLNRWIRYKIVKCDDCAMFSSEDITLEKTAAQEPEKVGDGVATKITNITKRKEAEAQILKLKDSIAQKATDKYLTLFNSIDEAVQWSQIITDDGGKAIDFRLQELNPAFEKMTGLKVAACQGKTIKEVLPDLEDFWIDTYAKVAFGGETIRFENWVESLGRWFDVYASSVGEKKDGEFVLVYTDITQQKETDKALRENEERNAFLLTLSDALRPKSDAIEIPKIVASITMDYFASERCFYGLIEGDLCIIKRDAAKAGFPSVSGTYPLDDIPIIKNVIQAAKAVAVSNVHTTDLVNESQRELCVQLQVISFIDIPVIKDGVPVGILCIVQSTPREWSAFEIQLAQEIAERMWIAIERASFEEGLRDSQGRLQLALNAAELGTFVWHIAEDRTETDSRALAHFDFPPEAEATLSESLANIFHPEDGPRYVKAIEHAIDPSGSGTLHQEFRIRRRNGEERWMSVIAKTLFEGSPLVAKRVTGVLADITERKKAENALQAVAERKAFLLQLTDALHSWTDPIEIERIVCCLLGKHMHADHVCYCRVDDDRKLVIVGKDFVKETLQSLTGIHPIQEFIALLRGVENGKRIVINDSAASSHSDVTKWPVYEENGVKAFVAVPLIKRGKLLGCMIVASVLPRRWTSDEIELQQEAMERLWNTIEKHRVENALAADLRDTQLLQNLSEYLVSEDNLQVTYQQVLDAAITLTHADAGTVQILDNDNSVLKLLATKGFPGDVVDYFRCVDARSNTSCGIALAKQQRTFIDFDVPEKEDPDGSLRLHVEAGYRSGQSTPLVSRAGKTIGMVSTHWRSTHHRPSERELRYLNLLARQTADLIEQRQVDAALRESEKDFRLLATATSNSIYKMSADWKLMYNLQGKDFLADTSNADNSWVEKYIPISERERVQQTIQQAIVNKSIFELEHQVLDANGHISWVYSRAVPKFNESEELTGWIGAGSNITERKKSEEALSESKERFRTLTDVVPQIIWTNDAQGKANYFNSRWYKYSGLPYEQSADLGWQAIIHPDDALSSIQLWENKLKVEEMFDTEFRLRGADGQYRWFIGRNLPLHDGSGNVVGWFGSATDIEDLKRTEKALQESRERLQVTMESAVEFAIMTFDPQGYITSWSKGAELIFDFDEQEVLGQHICIFFTAEDQQADVPAKEMEQARITGRATDDRWHTRKNGKRIFISGAVSPIWTQQGLMGFVKVAHDVTERKRLEQQREDFIGIASHELKTPVTSIKVYAEALIEQFEEEGITDKAGLMHKLDLQVDRLTNLIKDLLDTSKITAGELSLNLLEFNLTELIAERVEEIQRMSRIHRITYLGPEMMTVIADKERIGQVITNIVSNAIKYTPGGGMINIVTETLATGVTVAIEDNGIGIPSDVKQRVFDRFFRVGGEQMQNYPGMGLGLFISAGIIHRHGGTISVESEIGKGSNFNFFIPYNKPNN